jgi:hypothetical protein
MPKMSNWVQVVSEACRLVRTHADVEVPRPEPSEQDPIRYLFSSLVNMGKNDRTNKIISNVEVAAMQLGIHLQVLNFFVAITNEKLRSLFLEK